MEKKNQAAPEDLHVGRQIRDLRKAKRITLATLAKEVDKSVGYLSQVERGTSSLPIGVLQAISKALGVRASWFFHPEENASNGESEYIVRADHRRTMAFLGIGAREELLSPRLSGQLLLIMTRLMPGGSGGETPRRRKGEEAGYVAAGTLELTIGDQTFTLEAGDSFSLADDKPHLIHNPGETETQILWVMTGNDY
ncbi:transcriptional regulator, XRE family with cupin sensor [Modicisalibacter ilicicola DSM 19980]|uniref:Transcriptional regulator, XRE family with cupin sensor n=1 Tax=Modicisalibacter ilicicola DSM 19980 TaxID=1121942 RepID=A0A1M4WIG6_9GAMM|nr:XRE family transcriptional regulator [Halomonas ilicicola]SHE81081.1 transcriptional regulator, XRE family with cupin sensor [Halomonas ilicicola DSM 19980]